MTINDLQGALIREIEKITKEMNLVNCRGENVYLKGYQQAIPLMTVRASDGLLDEDASPDEAELFPYFITRVDTVKYQDEQAEGANRAHVMIAFAIYDEDTEYKGYYTLTAVMERVIQRFQTDPVLDAFWCERQMGAAYQEDDTYPQFFGALEMIWNLPDMAVDPVNEEWL